MQPLTKELADEIKEKIWFAFVNSNLPETDRNAIKFACSVVDELVDSKKDLDNDKR